MKKFILTVILIISFQNLFGQKNPTKISERNILQVMADSESDLLIRINNDMNDEELKSRIDVLHSFDRDIKIDYTRDSSGNIKTLAGSGGKDRGSCTSDDFGFLIISIKGSHWKGCMISDKIEP